MTVRQTGPIVIMGAGEAGVAAAGALRESGCDVPIVLLSAENYLPYERPPLSKELLLRPVEAPRPIRDEHWYVANGIDLRLGCRARAIDPERRRVSFDSLPDLPYDRLLLATGAVVRRLELGVGAEVHYLRTLDEARALAATLAPGKRIVVIGGGVIGLEVASAATIQGCHVTVLELADRLMSRVLTAEISASLLQRHREAGVGVYLNTKVHRVVRADAGVAVHLSNDERLTADVVVGAAGVTADDTLARSAGCLCDDGIVVDVRGKTSVAGIFAAGDVARFPHPTFGSVMRLESWQHAGRHGAHVARAMLGEIATYSEIPWFWTDQQGINLQVAGVVRDTDRTAWRISADRSTAFHFTGRRLTAVTTLNNARDIPPATRLIAAKWAGDPQRLVNSSDPLGVIARRLLEEQAQAFTQCVGRGS